MSRTSDCMRCGKVHAVVKLRDGSFVRAPKGVGAGHVVDIDNTAFTLRLAPINEHYSGWVPSYEGGTLCSTCVKPLQDFLLANGLIKPVPRTSPFTVLDMPKCPQCSELLVIGDKAFCPNCGYVEAA